MTDFIAKIREIDCIGCAKCLQFCPVDAIIGAENYMHTVIQDECIGCKLCVVPCPVDCIDLIEVKQLDYDKNKAKQRVTARKQRELRDLKTRQKMIEIDTIKAALLRAKNKHNKNNEKI